MNNTDNPTPWSIFWYLFKYDFKIYILKMENIKKLQTLIDQATSDAHNEAP